jgi:hypothetical protein
MNIKLILSGKDMFYLQGGVVFGEGVLGERGVE